MQILDPAADGSPPHRGRVQSEAWRPVGHRHHLMQYSKASSPPVGVFMSGCFKALSCTHFAALHVLPAACMLICIALIVAQGV